jgi:hypothetical protein
MFTLLRLSAVFILLTQTAGSQPKPVTTAWTALNLPTLAFRLLPIAVVVGFGLLSVAFFGGKKQDTPGVR